MIKAAKTIDKKAKTDVLVIGSGLAGCLAAVGCHEAGAKVTIATKGALGWGGSTSVCGGNSMFIPFPEDSRDLWMKELVERSEYTMDQEWLKTFIDETYGYALEIDRLGREYNEVIFPPDPCKPGSRFWRLQRYMNQNLHTLINLYASQNAFRKYIKAKGIEHFDRTEMSDLLTDGQRIIGAVGFNYRTGQTCLFQAKAVILACGTCTFTTDLLDVCGEAYAMAYDIGAKMMSFDRGGASVRPRYVMQGGSLCNTTVNSLGHCVGGKLVNRLGEEFFAKLPVEVRTSGRVAQNAAIRKEIAEGRGPIYEDFSAVRPEVAEELKKLRNASWKMTRTKHGVDLFKERVPVSNRAEQTSAPENFTRGGGVWVDHHLAGSIPGLYAAGDSTWAALSLQHPFTGLDLGWAMLSGAKVGKYAAAYASGAPEAGISDKSIVDRAGERIQSLSGLCTGPSGPSPDELKARLVSIMVPYDEVHCDRESLERGIARLVEFRDRDLPQMKAKDYHELKEAVELRSMTSTAEMILRSDLQREESRCGTRRQDFPLTDNVNWLKWTALEKKDGGMHIWTEDIPTPYIQAPKGKYPPPFKRM